MDNTTDYMLTTVDNPYNPFTQWTLWYKYDVLNGYDCCGLIARRTSVSPNYSDELRDKETEEIIDQIVNEMPMIYKKVSRSNKKENELAEK